MTMSAADHYWAGCAAGEIRYQKGADGHIQSYPRAFCENTGSREVSWHTSSGHGVIAARTVIGRAPVPEFESLVPYALVLVAMEEGFIIMAHAEQEAGIGDAVEAGFRPINGRHLPYFRRVAVG